MSTPSTAIWRNSKYSGAFKALDCRTLYMSRTRRLMNLVITGLVFSLFGGFSAGWAQSVYATPYDTRTIAGVAPVARTRAVEGAPFGFPAAVAVDQHGTVFVADGEAGSPLRMRPSISW